MAKPIQTDKIYCLAKNGKYSKNGINTYSVARGWFTWTVATADSHVYVYQGGSLNVVATLKTFSTSGHYTVQVPASYISSGYWLGITLVSNSVYVLYQMAGLNVAPHTLSFDFDKTNKKISNLIMVEGYKEGNYIDTRSAIGVGSDIVNDDVMKEAIIYKTSDGKGHYTTLVDKGLTNRTCTLQYHPTLTYTNNQAIRFVDIKEVKCGING